MKASKKIAVFVFTVMIVISCFTMTASAQTHWLSVPSNYNNTYTTASLTNARKDAKVKVNVTCTKPVSIKMTDTRNRVIWSETNAIPVSWMNCGNRTFRLGKDHSVYRLYFKSNGVGSVTVKAVSNCKVK